MKRARQQISYGTAVGASLLGEMFILVIVYRLSIATWRMRYQDRQRQSKPPVSLWAEQLNRQEGDGS